MFTTIVVGLICVLYCSADSLSDMTIYDKDGKNTCIGEFRCYLSLHESLVYKVLFHHVLEKKIDNLKYQFVIEQWKDADIMKEELPMCYDEGKKKIVLAEGYSGQCSATVPAGNHSVEIIVTVNTFKDIASLIVSGPNDTKTSRSVVSTLSSQPPAQIS